VCIYLRLFDLDLDRVILIHDLDLYIYILNMYTCISKMKFL